MDWNQFVMDWNLRFPLDRWWRSKHKIAFNSPVHRAMNPMDIMLEFMEDKLYNKAVEMEMMNKKKLDEFEKGKWLKEQAVTKEDENKLFDKLMDNFKLS